ncbi:MAG TPA: transcription-repair coupling factor [Thermoanaerobaculaceae bacterium]|nr:transcription-repair coupling factor [Thermoanaerobaculaceae bacterium]HRS14861.1 transcription-repair coupling factor [Thermoanaerobaculaceae bacterium]
MGPETEFLRDATERLRRRLGPGRRAICGVVPGARAVAVAALAGKNPAVVVVPSPRDAEELAAGLELLAPGLAAAVLPAEAVEAYHGRTPPLGATAAASLALADLAAGRLSCLVVPARLLVFPLPDPAALAARTFRIEVGQQLDVRQMASELVAAGYRRTELVEEAGDLALRGQVVDLATPAAAVRLVLDIDVVESIAELDPVSQRSVRALDGIGVPPLRLFAASDNQRLTLAARLEACGCTVAAAAAMEGRDPGLWEGFAGWVLPHRRVWELTDALVVCEPDAVAAQIGGHLEALRHARLTLQRDGVCTPPVEAWLAGAEICRDALAQADVVAELGLEDGTPWVRVRTAPSPNLASRPAVLLEELRAGAWEERRQVLVAASPGEAQRLQHLLTEGELPVCPGWPGPRVCGIVQGRLERGFVWAEEKLAVFGRADLTTLPPPARQRRTLARVLADVRDLRPGDFVVHADHGIGRFLGFRSLSLDGTAHECVELEYAGGGKLLVPLERADVLGKYAAAEASPPRLDRLGGSSWSRTKSRVKRALRDLAEDLLKVGAQRELAAGFAFSKDSPWQRDFEAAFEYEPTEDQLQAIAETKRDMESERPMDRLLVGDVGYGKTEVAMRAAFKAVLDGKQVAVLAPTTILAEQHLRTFTRRFAGFPVEIRWLSRFLPPAEQRQVVAGLAAGTVDIVIGTHRVLAADVRFRDLGLVIIDEEQRFGVAQKERLKALKASVDVLAMSATPIPRTLNLGLLGLRDVSVIETPPRDRLAVQTHVLPFRREVLREAILTELGRGGQVFFVHNRVASIGAMAAFVRETVPEASVVVAHGQMGERQLEKAMNAFLEGRADVLLATAIIENGLDIPNANTLIVNRADRFGLAQLYQLRGRVGRSDRLAFAYLFVPPEQALSTEARQRLAAIVEFAELGAGFRIAARDLEIRGAGNLLGAEQHGHLRAVGYETYCHLLEEAVAELRGQAPPPPPSGTELALGLDYRLPDAFIAEESVRLSVYRRVAGARDEAEIDRVAEELADRFGPPPPPLVNLLIHQRLRRRAEAAGIVRVRRTGMAFEVVFLPDHPAAHQAALALLTGVPGGSMTPAGVVRVPCAERDALAAARWLAELLPQTG